MPVDREQWTELTEFEHCAPGLLAFRALVALLDTWAGDDRAAAINHAESLLSNWPDAVRRAPWSWCKAAAKGAVPPTWPLVRALQLTTEHLSKGTVNLALLARHAKLDHITELEIPPYSDFQELSFLYHRPDAFPALKKLRARDKHDDGDVRALAGSPLWRTLESFEIEDVAHVDSLLHRKDASRIVPQLERPGRVRHLTLRSPDLIAVWDSTGLPHLRSAAVIVRSIGEARALAARPELAQLTSLSIAFRCGFSGSSPFEPFLGNIIEADEAAAETFFGNARLDRLEELAIAGYRMGYWGREGMGRLGLTALIASGLLQRLKRLSLRLLPLGDAGVAALAPALGSRLETLELVDVYCKGDGAAALSDSPCLASLRHLDLSANRIDAARFVQMASVDMPHLQSLDLSGPRVNPYYWNVGQQPLLDAGAAAWASSANARQLKRLRLQNGHLTDEALTALFRSSQLRNLEELDLSHNAFTAAAIAQAVVGSPLWHTLKELGLNHCRLDNAAIKALSRVDHAPALRSLQLGYNSIGPGGAEALARWPVLARVWHLDLHDNVIGHQGLIALARSPHLGRLLELDLEQDCWNSRKFTFSDDAARALATARSLARLDALFSGCVDEYHMTAYSPGFSKKGLDALRKAQGMRPAFQAACSDFSGVSEYGELAGFDEEATLDDQDFRRHPYTLNEREAEAGEHRMQQVRYPSPVDRAIHDEQPPTIRPSLPEPEEIGADVIEGLEFRDPTPATDISLHLDLSLEDSQRPLASQVGKVLSDTLGRLFKACSIGYFDSSGSTSRQGKKGRVIYTEERFSIGIKGDPGPAVQLIREALWWVGAPGDTDLEGFPLALTRTPATPAGRFLQLAAPKITRWNPRRKDDYRIDRVPFTAAQREGIRRILTEARAAEAEADSGWVSVATSDGGRMATSLKYLDGAPDFDTLNILVDVLTPEISCLVYKLMQECALMVWPMAFATSTEVARAIDCDWPEVEVVASAATLHRLLARGPYHWWSRASHTPS
jgi:hypothetical protein